MKKTLSFLTLIIALFIAGNSMAVDTVAKINFCDKIGDHDEPGWTSVYGTESTWPIDLGNGHTLIKVDGLYPHLGDSGLEDIGIELDGFPANVVNSTNYFANVAESYTLGFKVTGLDPNEKYNIEVFARGWASQDVITKFSVVEGDTIDVSTKDNDESISFTNISPNSSGEITLSATKLPNDYAYISAFFVTRVEQSASTDEIVAKINFCVPDGSKDEEGWASVYGTDSSYPIDLGNGMSMDKIDGIYPHMGYGPIDDIGIDLDEFPANVVNSSNYIANTPLVYAIGLKVSGLDPNALYTFDIFSRGWNLDQERLSRFYVEGEMDTITLNSCYNEELIYFHDLQPNSNGELTLVITKYAEGYAYISGWLVKKQGTSGLATTKEPSIRLYPNPGSDMINIDNLTGNSIISIYSMTGQKVKEVTGDSAKMKVDISDLTNGAYIFTITNSGVSRSCKIIKK